MRFLACCLLLFTTFNFSTLAFAGTPNPPLSIHNLAMEKYKTNLSFKVNGTCSSIFGSMPPMSTLYLQNRALVDACIADLHQCQILIYPSIDCSGSMLAVVALDVNTGVTGYTVFDANYGLYNSAATYSLWLNAHYSQAK
jgi:hypothetical protein